MKKWVCFGLSFSMAASLSAAMKGVARRKRSRLLRAEAVSTTRNSPVRTRTMRIATR
jgi:hypothetical protein